MFGKKKNPVKDFGSYCDVKGSYGEALLQYRM